MNSKKIDFRDLRVTLLKPLMVAERSQGRCWYPDLLKFSTGELMLNHSLNADRNDNAQDTQAVYLSTNELNNKSTNMKRSQKPATRTSYGLRSKTRPALYSAATPTKSPIRAMPPKTPALSATGYGCSAATRSSPSTHEHVGNIVSWLARHNRNGIVVKTFTPLLVRRRKMSNVSAR